MLKDLLDFVFPPRCVICGKETDGASVCPQCKSKIKFLEYPLILHRKNTYFYAITRYEGISEKLVKKLKFSNKKRIAEDLGEIFTNFINENNIRADFVGFVPMSKKELRSRGFNQSYLIARVISKRLNIPLFSGISKVKETEKQVGLSRVGRIKNVKNAFKFFQSVPGSLIVVDDVFTTGSTAREVARASKGFVKGNFYFIAFSQKMG